MFAKISAFVSNTLIISRSDYCISLYSYSFLRYCFDSWDEWIGLDCLLKHTEENIEKQRKLGMKQGIKSAMAWRVSKMKPRSPNGYLSSLFISHISFLGEVLAIFVVY